MGKYLAVVGLVLLTGCSAQSLYDGGRGVRVNQCQQYRDGDERRRCLDQATQSYQEYQQQTQSN